MGQWTKLEIWILTNCSRNTIRVNQITHYWHSEIAIGERFYPMKHHHHFVLDSIAVSVFVPRIRDKQVCLFCPPDEVGVHPELSDIEIVGENLKLLGEIAAVGQIAATHRYNMRLSRHGHLQNKLSLSEKKKF